MTNGSLKKLKEKQNIIAIKMRTQHINSMGYSIETLL